MGYGFITRRGGASNRKPIFENGEFKIQPTSNSWVIQNGELVSPSNSSMTITLPNDGRKKILVIDLYTVGQDGIMQITSDASYQTRNITSSYKNPTMYYIGSQKVITTSTVTGNTYGTNRYTFHIKQIWYEYLE